MMPGELGWYLAELKKQKKPGKNPENAYDTLFQDLTLLDETIRDTELSEEAKKRRINDLYTRVIRDVQTYHDQRADSLFGPSEWETDEGLLGQLFRDLTAQQKVMRDMSDSQTAKRTQYADFPAGMPAGSVTPGRRNPFGPGEAYNSFRNRYILSLIPPRFPQDRAKKQALETALGNVISRIKEPKFGDFVGLEFLIQNTDFRQIPRNTRDRFIRGEQGLPGEEGNTLLGDPDFLALMESENPFPNGTEEEKQEYRTAFLETCYALQMEREYLDQKKTVAGDRFYRYVDEKQVIDREYFADGEPDRAKRNSDLQQALSALAKKIYNLPAVNLFSDDSPEARERFANGAAGAGENAYNVIETDENFLALVNEAALGYEGTEEPEEYAAAASRLAGGLGIGDRVEQVVRVQGNGWGGDDLYAKDAVRGIRASGPNLRSPESFAADGAVLDSPELARQISDIQALRYLTGRPATGIDDLRFTFSDDDPKRITGVTDMNQDNAFLSGDDPEDAGELTVMSRSTADRIMALSPERLRVILGNNLSPRNVEHAVNRLGTLQQAIRESDNTKWAMADSLVPGKLHVVEDEVFAGLSVKQLASVQDNNPGTGLFSSVYKEMVLKGREAAEENRNYPGGLYQKELKTLMESQEDKESTPEFTAALNAVKTLNTELNRYMQADRELTEAERSALIKTYAESLVPVNAYVKKTRGWHWTGRGSVRHNAMATISGYMQEELLALQKYAPENHWKLEKIILHGRQDEIAVHQGEAEQVEGLDEIEDKKNPPERGNGGRKNRK